ncbi:MAG: type II toxin-antitoxin system HicB family antitoxin [Nanoarchaeota archaeon]|nr:type II toxin-antitoxin system HicB family antitoxin [Nanoarchaeota archaeon]
MKRDFTVVVEQGEDGYLIAEVVELPGCRTQAKSYDELMKRAQEAIRLYLKTKRSDSKTKFVGLQRIAV